MAGRIEIQRVSKVFDAVGAGKGVAALDEFSLDVAEGSFVSLIGPSGCGKSTLLRIISGLESPTEGQVLLDGERVTKPGGDIGMAFQQANLFPWMSVRDNVAFGLRSRGEYKARKGDVEAMLEAVGLTDFASSYPHQISGGMAQRASLARSLVVRPKALLLDEPLGALDALTRMSMQDEILSLWQEARLTVIMVTHDVDEAIYLSDKVVVMSRRPARVERVIDVKSSRPRARVQDEFVLLRSEVLSILGLGGQVHEVEYNL